MLSEIFYVGLYTSLIAFMLALSRQIYKSKCSEIEFCCIKVKRDTAGELKEDEYEIQRNKSQPEQKSNDIIV